MMVAIVAIYAQTNAQDNGLTKVIKISNPDHLEPIDPYQYDFDGYSQAVFSSLIGNARAELWMISRPSFSTEHAVMLIHEIKRANQDKDPFDPIILSENWLLQHVEAKKQIWRWKELKGGRSILDIHETKEVKKFQNVVEKDFAGLIKSAWELVLKQTRYPEDASSGVDGTTFHFYCSPQYYGETWSPSSGLPAMMVELGNKLGELAQAKEQAEKDRLIAACRLLAENIKTAAVKSK